MQTFLIRLLYKSQKILPFKNELLSQVFCIFPSPFTEEAEKYLLSLLKVYSNIVSADQYHKFYSEVQKWGENIDYLNNLY